MAKIATAQKKEVNQKKDNGAPVSEARRQETAKIAYQLFVERGHKHGHDREDWLRAEAIIKSRKKSE